MSQSSTSRRGQRRQRRDDRDGASGRARLRRPAVRDRRRAVLRRTAPSCNRPSRVRRLRSPGHPSESSSALPRLPTVASPTGAAASPAAPKTASSTRPRDSARRRRGRGPGASPTRSSQVTDRYDGIVVDSAGDHRPGRRAGGVRARDPVHELDAALADLSELGDVISRTEDTEDITAGEPSRASEAARQGARATCKARIELIGRHARESAWSCKSQIDSLKAQRRRRFEPQRRTGASAGLASRPSRSTSRRTARLRRRRLGPRRRRSTTPATCSTAIGGIALVSLAVLLPLALVARARLRGHGSRRGGAAAERALDAASELLSPS